jgi:hypothetical protein
MPDAIVNDANVKAAMTRWREEAMSYGTAVKLERCVSDTQVAGRSPCSSREWASSFRTGATGQRNQSAGGHVA